MVIITAAFCFLTNVPGILYTSAHFKTNVKLQTSSVFTLLVSVEEEIISSVHAVAELSWLQISENQLCLSSFLFSRVWHENPCTGVK